MNSFMFMLEIKKQWIGHPNFGFVCMCHLYEDLLPYIFKRTYLANVSK